MPRSVTATLAPLALLACAGAHPSGTAVGPLQRLAPPPHAPRWEAFVLPERDEPAVVATEADGTQHILAGTVRVSVHGEDLTWARDFPLHPIVARARAGAGGDHWLFATRDGLLLRAPSFTGPLTRVADTGGRTLREGFDSAGILVARDDQQRVWLGGPGDAIRLAPSGDGAPWVRATFADGRFGLALLAPGRVLRTTDGGAHFEPLSFGTRAAHGLRLQDGAFVVSVSDGSARVEAQGAPVDLPRALAAAADEPPATLSTETATLVRRGYNEPTYPFAYRTLQLDGVVLPDGRVAAFEYTDLVLYGPDGAQARMEAPADDCEIQLWGAQVLARCREDSHTSFHVTDGMRAWTELRTMDGELSATAAADGTSLVIDGACDGHESTRDETLLCWFDGVSWQTRTLRYRATPRALWGETLLYEAPEVNDDDEEERVAIFAVRAGENDVDRRVVVEPADAVPTSVHFAPSGEVLLTARKNGRVYAAVGDLSHALTLRPGPVGARVIRFADPTHALAAGTDLAHVWTSADAGRSWTPLHVPVDGDPAGVPTGSAESNSNDDGDDPVSVQCVAAGCFAGDRLVWASPYPFPGGAPIQTGRAVSAAHSPAGLHDEADDGREEGEGFQASQWRCEGRHREGAQPASRLYGPGGWLDARFAGPAGRIDGPIALSWTGQDERGGFHAAARPASLAPLGAGTANTSHEGLAVPRLITRTLAVFERCGNEGYQGQCDVVVAAAGATPRVIGSRTALLPFGAHGVDFVSALPTPDGGAALHLGSARAEGSTGVQADVLLRLSPRGDLAGRREYAWPVRTEVRMLAVGPEGPGLAVSARGDARDVRFYPMDPATPSRALPAFAGEHLAVCASPAGDAGATTVAVSSRAFGPSVYMGGMLITLYYARPMIEVGSQGPCLRGMSFWSWNPRSSTEQALVSDLGGVPVLRAVHGTLTGVALDARGNTPLTCTPQ